MAEQAKKQNAGIGFLDKALAVVPGLFTKAAHGFSFLVGLITNDTSSFLLKKATG